MGRARYIERFKHEPGIWICQQHWQQVPKALRRVKARHERQARRFGTIVRPDAYARLWRAIWRHLRD